MTTTKAEQIIEHLEALHQSSEPWGATLDNMMAAIIEFMKDHEQEAKARHERLEAAMSKLESFDQRLVLLEATTMRWKTLAG